MYVFKGPLKNSDKHMMVGVCLPSDRGAPIVTSLLLLVAALCFGQSTFAFTEPNDLASRAIALKDNFQAVSDAEITQSAARLRQNLTRLEEFLSNGDPEGWKQYLDWELLQEQLADGAEPDTTALREIHQKFTANHPGLELPQFRDVAAALQDYLGWLEVKALPDAAERHASLMQAMSEALPAYETEPTPEHTRTITQGLTWLVQTHQASDFVDAVRNRYSHPNLLVETSARFVSAGLVLPVDATQPIRENILGAKVTGRGRMTGTLTGEPLPDDSRASMQLKVAGRIDASTIARQGPVRVTGRGVTSFTAFKSLTFDQTGFSGGASRSCARSNNRVCCIDAPFLIKSLARMKLNSQQAEADRITAQRARPVINNQLDQDAGTIIDDANEAYLNEFRNPLVRSGAFPQRMNFRTSAEGLSVVILQAGGEQIGAPQSAPTFTLKNDIGIRLHESAFNNIADSLLSGVTMTDEDVRSHVLKYLTMAALDEYAPEEEEEPWSVTFARENPISVSFREGAYTLVIAGERWKSGRRSFRNLNVTVTYRIDSTEGNVRLVRDEEILIAPPGFVRGKDRLSPLTISARRLLQRKFEQLLPEVIEPDQLVVPGPWEKAGPLNVVDMAADSGWLIMSWEMQSHSPTTVAGRPVHRNH